MEKIKCYFCGHEYPSEEIIRFDTVTVTKDGVRRVIKSKWVCEDCAEYIGWKEG